MAATPTPYQKKEQLHVGVKGRTGVPKAATCHLVHALVRPFEHVDANDRIHARQMLHICQKPVHQNKEKDEGTKKKKKKRRRRKKKKK